MHKGKQVLDKKRGSKKGDISCDGKHGQLYAVAIYPIHVIFFNASCFVSLAAQHTTWFFSHVAGTDRHACCHGDQCQRMLKVHTGCDTGWPSM